MDKKSILLGYIKEEIMHGRGSNITADDDLLKAGILDSLGILQLVAFIEKQFGLQVPDEDVIFENFFSVSALSNYLQKLEADNIH